MAITLPDGRWIRVNEALSELLGRTREELVGASFESVTHPDDRASGRDYQRRALAGELDRFQAEKRYIHRDGHVIWAAISVVLVRDAAGEPLHFILQVQDISARKAMEAALRASEARHLEEMEDAEQRYRSLFDQHPDAVVAVDADGHFTAANPACGPVSGYAPHELVGRHFAELVPPADLPAVLTRFNATLAGVVQSYETVIRHRSGRPVRIAITNVPIVVRGEVVGAYGIVRDLTEQHALEEQLRQSQKMEAVGRLAGGIAHDFNNLLTAILSNAELALAQLDEGPVREDVATVRDTAERAAALTRQLLAFSRKQVVRPRLLDLNLLVSDVERLLRRTLAESIDVRLELGPEPATVLAEPSQLEQVILNLAVNAGDAMPDGGTLTLRTGTVVVDDAIARRHRGLRRGSYVTLVVTDTGIGIPAEVMPRIFEPFFTTKEPGEGTGLGLPTVYGIVKQYGGYTAVESFPGEGTTFTIFLPRRNGHCPTEQRTVASDLPRGTERVLVAEDEATVRTSMHRILAAHGYTVVEAANGAEALRAIETAAEPFDLLMTDLVMPEMGGRELVSRVRARGAAPRVLVISGYDEQAVLRGAPLPEQVGYLEKPFTVEALLRMVRETLDAVYS